MSPNVQNALVLARVAEESERTLRIARGTQNLSVARLERDLALAKRNLSVAIYSLSKDEMKEFGERWPAIISLMDQKE